MTLAASAPLNRDLRVISLIGVAHGISHFYQLVFITMLLIVRQEAGLSFTDVGILGSIFYGTSGLCQTAAGFAVDRFGARPILAAGLAITSVGIAFIALAHSFVAFAAIAVFTGLGNCVFHPADFALLNASVDQRRLGRAFSIHGLGGSLGWAAAPTLYFLDAAIGWAGAALVAAVPGIVLAVAVWSHRSHLVDHRAETHKAAASPDARSTLTIFTQLPILICLLYFVLLAINTVGIQQFAVPAWIKMFGTTESYAALCLIVFVVGSAAGMLVGGIFADRVRRHDLVAACGLLAAGALTVPVAAQSVSAAWLLPILALAGFAGGTTGPSRDMIVRSATPAGTSGKVFGFVYSGLDIGSFLAPSMFGHLIDSGRPAMIFWIAAILYGINTMLVMTIRSNRPSAVAIVAE